jgi:hypothetical protein
MQVPHQVLDMNVTLLAPCDICFVGSIYSKWPRSIHFSGIDTQTVSPYSTHHINREAGPHKRLPDGTMHNYERSTCAHSKHKLVTDTRQLVSRNIKARRLRLRCNRRDLEIVPSVAGIVFLANTPRGAHD